MVVILNITYREDRTAGFESNFSCLAYKLLFVFC